MAMLCLQPQSCIIEDDFHVLPLGGGRCLAPLRIEVCSVDDEPPIRSSGSGLSRLASRATLFEVTLRDIAPPPRRASSLEVLCIGFEAVGIHTEYNFRISHSSGCSWKVQRRYSTLLSLHEELSNSLPGLPPFPQKASLSQHLTSEKDVSMQRAVSLQRYFQLLQQRGDALGLGSTLRALGAEKPDVVQDVRVVRWDRVSGTELAVELEVVPSVRPDDCPRPVEGLEVRVKVPSWLRSRSNSRTSDGTTVMAPVGKLVRLPVMPDDTELDLSVRAWNALGSSPPMSLRVSVPSREPRASPVPACLEGGGDQSPTAGPAVGGRVDAIWAGDGHWYGAVVRHVDEPWGWIVVDWLRPRPLDSGDRPRCVCEAGGDDTTHRRVLPSHVRPVLATWPSSRMFGCHHPSAMPRDLSQSCRESI